MMSALFLIEAESCKVLRVWYENDWDLLSTKDLVVEEVASYRAGPRAYLEAQIGVN